MASNFEIFDTVWVEPAAVKLGRPLVGEKPMTPRERKQRQRAPAIQQRIEDIAVLDFETDPFDNSQPDQSVLPFTACLYSDQFETVIIWDENFPRFIKKVIAAIEKLPRKFTIYAHNGGKFDFMFLVSELRGQIKFKGRAIMVAKIGDHELRDSFHIIPERLANFQKDDFDYTKLTKKNRRKFKAEIIKYMTNDCRYLFDIVKSFVLNFGMKLSIGQAAMWKLKQHYKPKNIGANMDAYLRQYFFGGRVECLAGRGHWEGPYKLFDVNSMYPFVMATKQHPIGNEYTGRITGGINEKTVFLKLSCRNFGALVRRDSEKNETSANFERGEFFTTIWEYEVAKKYDLISDVRILAYIDNNERSDFSDFVVPMYEQRQKEKEILKALEAKGQINSFDYNEHKKNDMFLKFLLNNAYGKFAQNPRKFKEWCVTDPDEKPEGEWGELPCFQSSKYALWQRPAPGMRFNNVGTAASITGAARAVLMEAIVNADDPIYCDTDSLICRNLHNTELHPTKLGAWDLEKNLSEVVIAGKKLYAYRDAKFPDGHKEKEKVRSKGVSGLTFADVMALLDDQYKDVLSKAPTLTKFGTQNYMTRRVRATVPVMRRRINYRRLRVANG